MPPDGWCWGHRWDGGAWLLLLSCCPGYGCQKPASGGALGELGCVAIETSDRTQILAFVLTVAVVVL
jgi:hypothetical protein